MIALVQGRAAANKGTSAVRSEYLPTSGDDELAAEIRFHIISAPLTSGSRAST